MGNVEIWNAIIGWACKAIVLYLHKPAFIKSDFHYLAVHYLCPTVPLIRELSPWTPIPLQQRLSKDIMPRTSNLTHIMHKEFFFFVGSQWARSSTRRAGYIQVIASLLCSHTVGELECDSVDVSPGSHDILPLLWTWQMDLFISTSISLLHPHCGPCISYEFTWVQRRDVHRPSHFDCFSGL